MVDLMCGSFYLIQEVEDFSFQLDKHPMHLLHHQIRNGLLSWFDELLCHQIVYFRGCGLSSA